LALPKAPEFKNNPAETIMCGRYNLTASSEAIVEHFQLLGQGLFQPSYNIAPAQKILNIVELEDQSKKAVNLFWGLVLSWAKDSKNSSHLINVRSETVREKSTLFSNPVCDLLIANPENA
jgi:putative SOS response-associated peptidase YedK